MDRGSRRLGCRRLSVGGAGGRRRRFAAAQAGGEAGIPGCVVGHSGAGRARRRSARAARDCAADVQSSTGAGYSAPAATAGLFLSVPPVLRRPAVWALLLCADERVAGQRPGGARDDGVARRVGAVAEGGRTARVYGRTAGRGCGAASTSATRTVFITTCRRRYDASRFCSKTYRS